MSYNTVENPTSPRANWDSVLASYRGILGWLNDGTSAAVEVELYIKDHPIPMRKPKFTEVNTVTQMTPVGLYETKFTGIFQGASEPLQVALQGWIITPISGNQWVPKDTGGSPLSYGNRNYCEVITGFLTGEFNSSTGGAMKRRDPDYYITPYGHQYNKPIIFSWDYALTSNARKATFSMTLYLER